MRKIISLSRDLYLLLIAYKELGFKPVLWSQYTRLFFKKMLSVQEYLNYKDIIKEKSFCDSFLSYGEAEVYWKILNPNKYSAIARDKYLTHIVLEKVGIPMPKLYAYYNSETGHDYDHVREQLCKNEVQQCVIKPAADSAHGSGVFVCKRIVFKNNDCVLEKTDGQRMSLKQLLEDNKKVALLFEEKINQTSQINSINSSSVNTVRFMTALFPNNEVKVMATFMKIGRKGSDIDNAGGGGNVDCGIDTMSGRCYNTVQFNSFKDIKHIEKHPDAGTQIENVVIDNWNEIVECVKCFQSQIPYLKIIGWDIALTDKGPVVVEMNNWWDTTGQLFIGRGWRDEVVECYNIWKEYYKQENK